MVKRSYVYLEWVNELCKKKKHFNFLKCFVSIYFLFDILICKKCNSVSLRVYGGSSLMNRFELLVIVQISRSEPHFGFLISDLVFLSGSYNILQFFVWIKHVNSFSIKNFISQFLFNKNLKLFSYTILIRFSQDNVLAYKILRRIFIGCRCKSKSLRF